MNLPLYSAALGILCSPTFAVIIATEDFGNHPNFANLTGDGSGWSGNWTNQVGTGQYFNSPTLFSTALNVYEPSGGTYGFVGHSGERAGRIFDTSASGAAATVGLLDSNSNIGADGTTVYIGVAIRAHKGVSTPSQNDPTHFYGLDIQRGGISDPFRVLQVSTDGFDLTKLNLRANNDTSTSALIGDLTTEVEYWVLRVDFGIGDADSVSFFRNPELFAAEGAPSATVNGTNFSFDRLSFSNFGGNLVDVDDFRIGTEYADVVGAVVPEPTTFLLSTLGFLVLFNRRRPYQ